MKMNYVKFEVPKELGDKALEALELARNTGKIRKGVNEVTKAVEKGHVKLAIIADDVQPPEIVMHLPMLCDEKNIPYLFVSGKEAVGSACGLRVPTATGCIIDEGKAKDIVSEIIEKLNEIRGKK